MDHQENNYCHESIGSRNIKNKTTIARALGARTSRPQQLSQEHQEQKHQE